MNQPLPTEDSDWITYHTVVSTSDRTRSPSPPATCSANGTQNGRHYFEYNMGRRQILDFFAYVSGRYQNRKEVYQGLTATSPSRSTTTPRTPTTSTT